MPRAARFRIAAIEDLLAQLRYAPDDTRLKQMNAAERLLAEVDPDRSYPEDFVTFRITGYRPDSGATPATFVGGALVSDLVIFIQALSDELAIAVSDLGRSPLSLAEVAARLRVSGKTVQRYRRLGLVCHYVTGEGGPRRLVCFEDALEAFATRHAERVTRAAGFSRVDAGIERRIIREAMVLRDEDHLTLNEAALRLAQAHGRAHETVRAILRRHDRRASTAIFDEHGAMGDRDLRLIHRAVRRGVPVAALMRRFGKSRQSIGRAATRRQADLLRAVDLRAIVLPTFALDDAASVILAARARETALPPDLPRDDAIALVGWLDARPAASAEEEPALLAAYNFLKHRAHTMLAAAPTWPSTRVITDVERDLRWATRLKRRLIVGVLPGLVRTIEQRLHRGLLTQRAEEIRRLLRLAIEVASASIETVDPSRDQSLARVARYGLERRLATLDIDVATRRAAAVHEPGAVRLDGWLDGVTPWSHLVELPPELAADVAADVGAPAAGLDAAAADVLRRIYGLDGVRPQTRTEIAAALGVPRGVVSRRLLEAERRLRRARRSASSTSSSSASPP